MIYKCKDSDAALKYNPKTMMLGCDNCGSMFETEEIEFCEDSGEVIELKIFSCTSCGAELAVNDVEASTFCAYCGQPTIIFKRVDKKVKPAYIIPFLIDKEQAEHSFRSTLERGFFIPKKIRHFEPESLHGIYIPFWMFDIYYHDKQTLKGEAEKGDSFVKSYFFREAEVEFRNITADASSRLSDEFTQRLESYDFKLKKEFDPGYLAGYYADCYDVKREDALRVALDRAREMYDGEIIKSVNAHSIKILRCDPEYKVLKSEYIMLPAWFMTFRYKNEAYTLMMNGQTGKIIGAVPFMKIKFFTFYFLFASVLTSIVFLFWHFALENFLNSDLVFWVRLVLVFLFLLYFFTFALTMKGKGLYFNTIKNIRLTKAKNTNEFVKNRQEDK